MKSQVLKTLLDSIKNSENFPQIKFFASTTNRLNSKIFVLVILLYAPFCQSKFYKQGSLFCFLNFMAYISVKNPQYKVLILAE